MIATKLVNGKRVRLSQNQHAEIESARARYNAEQPKLIAEHLLEEKINARMRALAIKDLKDKGEL